MGMAKYDRLLYILNMLRSRKNLNAKKIAEECGVTERSIYRDITSLSEANVPIYFDCGYKLASDNFLPPLNFDFSEYQFLRLSLESSPLNSNEKYKNISSRVQAKIDAVISKNVFDKEKFTPRTTKVEITSTDLKDKENLFLGLIEQAIESASVIEINYDSIATGLSKRKVEPYFVIFKGRAFYFVAYCQKRKDFRTFRLNRLKSVGIVSETFVPKAGVSAEKYFEDSWQVFSGDPVEISIRFIGKSARIVNSGTYHHNEVVEKISDNEIIYNVKIKGVEEIKRWILGFGAEAEVISPDSLRENILEIANSLQEKYNSK